ncbi:MAG TPA: hypothetical protein VLJ37_02590 [bacterium]|nr:hypothetical protein [bacterium]
MSANARAEENAELARQAIDLEAQVQGLQDSLEIAQLEARELRDRVEVYKQFEKVAGMEQRLRVKAESQANEYLQVIESFEAGIGQLREAILSLRRKFAEASLRVEPRKEDRDEHAAGELGELRAQLADRQAEIEAMKVRLRDVDTLNAAIGTLRLELENAKASEQTARKETSRHRTALDAVRAQAQNTERMEAEIGDLRNQLAAKGAEIETLRTQFQDTEAMKADIRSLRSEIARAKTSEEAAKKEASQHRAALETARAREQDHQKLVEEIERLRKVLRETRNAEAKAKEDALEQREAAKKEKARADRNERLGAEASQLRERVRELERAVEAEAATRRRIRDVLGSVGTSTRPRNSDSGVMLRPEVAQALETLGLTPSASYEQYKTVFRSFVEVYHPDRLQDSTTAARKLAEARLRDVNKAQVVLEAYFGPRRASQDRRDCA